MSLRMIREVDFNGPRHEEVRQLITLTMRETRRRLGLSLESFAAVIQRRRRPGHPTVSPGAVAAWEAGTVPPADVLLIALSEARLEPERIRRWIKRASNVLLPLAGLVDPLGDLNLVRLAFNLTAAISPWW